MHTRGISHRDIKPENLMLSDSTHSIIKIVDFGLSQPFSLDQSFHSVVGTPYYVAPEVLSNRYDEKCDIWSMGIVLYIMLCGYPPSNGKSTKEVVNKIKGGNLKFDMDDWKKVSKEGRDLVGRMLKVDKGERITIKECFNHHWVQSIIYKFNKQIDD